MIQVQVIGNIGKDAEEKTINEKNTLVLTWRPPRGTPLHG